MINPKYDPNNYSKHLAIPVITDNQKINQLFGSYLLRVKWWHDNPKISPPSDLIGTLRVHTDTPFGALEPRDYQLKVSSHKQIYVQFLSIPIPEFEYKIEVIHPAGLTRSRLEIWEYNAPSINQYVSPMTGQNNPSAASDPAILAALTSIVANTQATQSAVVASDENTLAYVQSQTELTLGLPVFSLAGNAYRIHAADPKCRELVISNNNVGAGKFKLAIVAPADGQPYTSMSNVLGNPIETGGSFTIDDPMCRGDIFAVGSVAGMKISVAKSAKV